MPENIFDTIEKHDFDKHKCFLCAVHLNNSNQTREHVIPKWIQKEYGLWDETISLLNGSAIKYRHLTIPCCKKCNSVHLNKIEEKIMLSHRKGISQFRRLNKKVVFLWLSKIYFGLMYKELFLNEDRKNKESGPITTPEYIKQFYTLMMMIQGIRNLHTCKDFAPASVFIFKTQLQENKIHNWDFIDIHATAFISIRLGKIGIVCLLQDCGIVKSIGEYLNRYNKIQLNPIQFRELCAQIYYKGTLINRTPKYLSYPIKGKYESRLLPLQGLSSKPIFNTWINKDYAEILSRFVNTSLDQCYIKDKYMTWLPTDI